MRFIRINQAPNRSRRSTRNKVEQRQSRKSKGWLVPSGKFRGASGATRGAWGGSPNGVRSIYASEETFIRNTYVVPESRMEEHRERATQSPDWRAWATRGSITTTTK